jgi:hypothetical protein
MQDGKDETHRRRLHNYILNFQSYDTRLDHLIMALNSIPLVFYASQALLRFTVIKTTKFDNFSMSFIIIRKLRIIGKCHGLVLSSKGVTLSYNIPYDRLANSRIALTSFSEVSLIPYSLLYLRSIYKLDLYIP